MILNRSIEGAGDGPAEEAAPDGRPAPAQSSQARADIEELMADYRTWARADVARATQLFQAIKAERSSARDAFAEIFQAAHDIKGQGTSFGYPLVTRIADSLCRLARDAGEPSTRQIEVAGMHIKALDLVLAQGITGSGGLAGAKICESIEAATRGVLGE